MNTFISADTVEFSNLHMVIEWFIRLRWIACSGVFLTLIALNRIFEIQLPYTILFITSFILFLANSMYTLYLVRIKKRVLTNKEKKLFLHIQIISDYILLLILVYFTGYLENPMIYYLVFHIMLTSFLFTEKILGFYTTLLVSAILMLSFLQYKKILPYFPLSLFDQAGGYYNRILDRTAGISSILIITAYLISRIKEYLDFKGKLCEVELSHYKSLDKVKSNFILQVTHELRGPLAAVMGFHEILLKGITGELPIKATKVLTKANHRTDNLLTMIDEMIDFAYMKSEKDITYEEKNLQISALIFENISLIKEHAEKKGITFTVNCSRHIQLKSNRDLMNMILGNLLTNALRYSRENGEISITCSKEKNTVHLVVTDKGIGIGEEDLEKIFEEFYRTKTAKKIEKDGTGLGLAIVKRAVNSLGGKVNVFSSLNDGTSFHIYLPDSDLKEALNGKTEHINN
jgi:signal transduction histidine kinase